VIPKLKYDDPSVHPYPDDIAKAKSLLASAGVTHLNLNMVIIGTDAPSVQTATILQAAWAQVGVTLTIKPEDVGTFFSDAPKEDTNLLPWIVNSSDVTVDDEFSLFQYDQQPMQWGHGTNLLLKQLTDKATTTESETVRTKLFHQLQRAAMNYAMVVPLVDASQETAVTSKVHGFSALPAGWWRLDQVWLSH
jgi:ABC-type transport system substrate-binding protein